MVLGRIRITIFAAAEDVGTVITVIATIISVRRRNVLQEDALSEWGKPTRRHLLQHHKMLSLHMMSMMMRLLVLKMLLTSDRQSAGSQPKV